MKIEDYPLVVINGRALRRVPELVPRDDNDDCWCDMCMNERNESCNDINEAACEQLDTEDHCGDNDTIYLPEENFTEYVVEAVRRRVS